MFKAKTIVAIFVGVLALTALASSSASAASWKVAGTLLNGSAAVATKATVTENPKITFSTLTIECAGIEEVGSTIVHPDRASDEAVLFSECKATGGNCTLVGTTIKTTLISELVYLVGAVVLGIVKPQTKSTFATLAFEGASCAFAETTQPITGQVLAVGPTGTVENTLQELVANTPSGELKLGSSAMTLKGKAQLKLASGLPWSFR